MFQNSAGRRCPRHPAAAASESNTTRPWSVDYWIPWPIPIPCPAKSSRPWRDPGPTWPTPSSSPPGTGRALAVVAFPLSLRVGPGRAADPRGAEATSTHLVPDANPCLLAAGRCESPRRKKRSRDLPPNHTHMNRHGKARSLSLSIERPMLL